jgi:hypothetical protein
MSTQQEMDHGRTAHFKLSLSSQSKQRVKVGQQHYRHKVPILMVDLLNFHLCRLCRSLGLPCRTGPTGRRSHTRCHDLNFKSIPTRSPPREQHHHHKTKMLATTQAHPKINNHTTQPLTPKKARNKLFCDQQQNR